MAKPDAVTEALTRVLADSYALYFKTHAFHWNVTGPTFFSLHEMFAAQYNEVWTALDEIAERIRALGGTPPSGPSALGRYATIAEAEGNLEANAMVRELYAGNQAALKTIKAALAAAQKAGDEATADLLITRTEAHDKHAWMLKSTLAD
ncbi:MAG: DNA starvation/stationary phase protection protein [Alphaproteobacteria bacterium]|nr:DNA starvation/stationary phase protection protein [Alphaproteobacteria bacterium]